MGADLDYENNPMMVGTESTEEESRKSLVGDAEATENYGSLEES